MRDANLHYQGAGWLYHYHRLESLAPLFDKTAHYAMLLMYWADQMERNKLQLHAFNLAPTFYEVLVSGPADDCQPSLRRAMMQFLAYRRQSCAGEYPEETQNGNWPIRQTLWAKHSLAALEGRAKDCTGPTVISSWHYPECSLITPLLDSPAANRTQPMVDTRLRPVRLD